MPDGSLLRLHKLDESYDPQDRTAALSYLQAHQARGEIVTGLLYLAPNDMDLHAILDTVAQPLNQLGERELCPGNEKLQAINQSLR